MKPAFRGNTRNPGSVDLSGVTPVQLDIADPASVTAAAATAKGVSILVNNAGIETGATLLNGDIGEIRREFDTNFFGTLAVTRAFAPQLGEHEESYILNVLSVLSWLNVPWLGCYVGRGGGVSAVVPVATAILRPW
jgi:NAD(P)-dependent dehydrogenase (short-subunit alcohol dehydrogenase family)